MGDIAAIAVKNSHIQTSEIEQDILDTEREIVQMEREAEHLAATPASLSNARWDHIRAEARHAGIRERKKFIENLRAIHGDCRPFLPDKCECECHAAGAQEAEGGRK